MGALFASLLNNSSNDSSPTLPVAVKEIDLRNGNKEAIEQFRADYRNLGVAVLEIDENFYQITQQYRTICDEWFNANSFDQKRKYIAESKDELFRELGRRPNIGYILTEHKKEYLKFKNSSDRAMYPTQQIYDIFKQLYAIWDDAAMTCMEAVLSEPVPSPKQDANGNARKEQKTTEQDEEEEEEKKAETMPAGYEPLTSKKDRDNIRKFGGIHASISLIHYFNQLCEAGGEAEEKLSADEKLMNRTEEVPLGIHVDTGLMTLITCSDVAGLEVLDRKTNKYFYPEKIFDPKKHIFVIAGRKMELFTWKDVVKPTWHAVRIPVQHQRNSLLYFLEIQKDH